MARVTVEDCIEIIPNRFDLVVTAAQRAKQIASGSPLTQERVNDKDSVVSLREIADQTIDIELVNEDLVQSYQKQHGFDHTDVIEDDVATLDGSEDGFASFSTNNFLESAEEGYSAGMSFIEDNVEVDD